MDDMKKDPYERDLEQGTDWYRIERKLRHAEERTFYSCVFSAFILGFILGMRVAEWAQSM